MPPPPHIIAIIACTVVTAYFALCIGPYLAANANPDRGFATRYKVLVVDLDGSTIGSDLIHFYTVVLQQRLSSVVFPIFEVATASSITEVRQMVTNQKAWAAVYAAPGATAKLASVVNDCTTVGSYVSSNAFGVVLDSGRANSPALRLNGLLTAASSRFTNYISSQLLDNALPSVGATSAQVSTCISQGTAGTTFLSTPVDYTLVDNSATSTAPVMVSAFAVGNILVAVFCSLYVALAILKGVGPLENLSPVHRMFYRLFVTAMFTFGIALVFASCCVGLTNAVNADHPFTSTTWGELFAIQWLHGSLWSFGMLALGIGISPDVIGLPFGFILVSNIIGGFGK